MELIGWALVVMGGLLWLGIGALTQEQMAARAEAAKHSGALITELQMLRETLAAWKPIQFVQLSPSVGDGVETKH